MDWLSARVSEINNQLARAKNTMSAKPAKDLKKDIQD